MFAVGCDGHAKPRIEVDVRVAICRPDNNQCFSLGVPQASVDLTDAGGRVISTGTTDAAGNVTFDPKANQQYRIVVKSPLFRDGQAAGQVDLGGDTAVASVSIVGEFAEAG